MNNRQTQMQWLLALTALSLVPVYILLGWQSGGHSPNEITDWLQWFWRIEAGAWGLRALVESAALIYLFQTATTDSLSNKILVAFEIALISLIALTVGLVIVSNGSGLSIANGLPNWLYWIWSFGVAAFAPLMMGSVGYAYKVHKQVTPTISETDTLHKKIGDLARVVNTLSATIDTLSSDSITTRREEVQRLVHNAQVEGVKLTQKQLAEQLGVSLTTIRGDIKAMTNGRVK